MLKYKQTIVVRTDIEMSRGKIAAQVAHAACQAAELARSDLPRAWKGWVEEGARKVVLMATKAELMEAHRVAKSLGLPTALVRDAGLTELKAGTITAVAVGPHREEPVDKVTGRLKPLK